MAKMNCLRPLQALEQDNQESSILVILNMPLLPNTDLVKHLWKNSVFKLTVDGGTNRLYENLSKDDSTYFPDCISGDFDSVRSEVKEYFERKNVEIISTPDQDDNDFTKGLQIIGEKMKSNKIAAKSIIVVGAYGGRLDQIFANIDTLFKFNFEIPIYLMSDNNIAVLLKTGSHKIDVQSAHKDVWCGLIPIGQPCNHVTTTGLKWNLDDQSLKFGELISTSNTYESDNTRVVTIETDNPLLWTMGYVL